MGAKMKTLKSQPKFKFSNPSNKEERLIVELIKALDDTTYKFLKMHYPGNISEESFIILRDGAIGYAGGMIRDLGALLQDREIIPFFLEEAKNIFDCYIEVLKKEL